MQNIKAITFDLDGVYFPAGKNNFLQALQHLGVGADEARRVFLNSDEMNKRYKLGTMSDNEYWSWAAKEWQLTMSPNDLISLLIDSYDVDPDVSAVVKGVRRQGYQTLICSNNFPARINGLQNKFGFLDDFDVTIFSYEVGASKPSPAIFSALIEKAGVDAQEIVFADDKQTNVVEAQAAGITSFIYENFEQFATKLKSFGINIA